MARSALSRDSSRPRGRRPAATLSAWLAWSLAGLSLAMFVTTVVLYFAARSAQFPSSWGNGGFGSLLIFLPFLAFPVVGALIVSRHPGNLVGWICVADGFLWMLAILTGPYAQYGVAYPGSVPFPVGISALTTWLWVPAVGLLGIYLILLFPDGRLPSKRWRLLAWFAGVVIFYVSVAFVVTPGPLEGLPGVRNPFGLEGYSWVEDAGVVGVSLLPLCILASALSLILRFRRSGHEARQQIKWLAFAASLVGLAYLCTVVATLGFAPETAGSGSAQPAWLSLLQDAVLLSYAVVPVAVGVAVLKHHLYDIDLVINRTLVYGALTASVVGVYVLVVGYLGLLFRAGNNNLLISLVAAGLVAVLFAPLRDRLQRSVNRLMYGERDEPYAVISRLGQRLENTLASDAALPTVARTLAEALKLPYAAIEIRRDGRFETSAEHGDPTGVADSLRLPLVYGDEMVGRLVLGPRVGGGNFTPADRRLLEDLARQVGVAVHAIELSEQAVRLSADLQRSRERLVTAREAERRRLRRDLHDGLGPQLASLSMKAEVARDLLSENPTRSEALLEDITVQAQEAVTDVRRLVYGLRPPALDDLGLAGALRAQAAHGDHGGLRVSVEAPEGDSLPPLPAAVEVAAYRIAQEAVANAAHHAKARNCTVKISPDARAGVLRLEVTDDGRGIPEDRAAGVGLSSMRERAGELGGTCTIEAVSSGGTRVVAVLPLAHLTDVDEGEG